MHRVLWVSLRFPPHGGGGVQRNAYFARYLPQFGWMPHVLTGPGDQRRSLRDDTLRELIPPEVRVTRARAVDLDALFKTLAKVRLSGAAKLCTLSLPAMEPGWVPFAFRRGLQIVSREAVDVICSSSYPMSSHLVAYLLKKRTGLAWVADYRDEWSLRRMMTWRTRFHWRLALGLDRMFVRNADRVVTTSPAHTRRFREAFGGPPEKYVTVTNGFDEADFGGTTPARPPELRGKFLISHVGSVFEWRSGDAFLTAVRRVIEEGTIPPDRIRVAFVGATHTELPRDLVELGVVASTGYLSHGEAVRWMRQSDVLLLVNTEQTNIPGKTFEYLAAGNPILALVRKGPTADLVREAGSARVMAPDDVDRASRALRDLYVKWDREELTGSQGRDSVVRFSRRRTTDRLVKVLERAAGLSESSVTPLSLAAS